MAVSLQRLTLFALITEFETDCREVLSTHVLPFRTLSELIGQAARDQIELRAQPGDAGAIEDQRLVGFLDIGDAIKSLLSSKTLLSKEAQQAISATSRGLELIPSIRNRVMHQRPILFEDMPALADVCRTLSRKAPREWPNTAQLLAAIQSDPNFASSYGGIFQSDDATAVLHNLPVPEFDDTGFLGRRDEIAALQKAILGPYPIITILGVGGVGKTALAVHAAYALVSRSDCPFEAVIWTSAKATRLTAGDIDLISNAIRDSIGIANDALAQFGDSNHQDPFTALVELLSTFKILLIIDNLETVLDENIRHFVRQIPTGSKVLFTSRVGLGAFDFTVPVGSLVGKEPEAYFRRVSTVWSQGELASLPVEQVRLYCNRLTNNPLGIKWFVQAVAAGARPQALVANPETLLRFCLENILDKLATNAKLVLEVLAVTSRRQTPAAIMYLSGLDASQCDEALRALFSSNLINIFAGQIGQDDNYQITPIALTYLSRYFSPDKVTQEAIRRKQSALVKLETEADLRPEGQYVYDPSFICIRRECAGTDAVAAGLLRKALSEIKQERFDEALEFVDNAKRIAPNYFEALRVEAYAAAQAGNAMRAQSAYEEAIALRPNHPPLRVLFAGFLLRFMEDPDGAIHHLTESQKLDHSELAIPIEMARAYLHLRDYTKVLELAEAVDITQSRNARLSRVYHDLLLQVYLRQAENFLEQWRIEPFVENAERFLMHIKVLPEHVLDERMARHARNMLVQLKRCLMREGSSPLGVRADFVRSALAKRFEPSRLLPIEEVGGRLHGRIVNLPVGQKFGFLERGDGSRLFFHQSFLLETDEFDSLAIGDEVTFTLGRNNQGECAAAVKIVAEDDAK